MTTITRRFLIDWPMVAGAFLFILVGGGFCAFGGWHLYRTVVFLEDADRVPARVIDVEVSRDDDAATYRPTLSYTDRQGVERVAQSYLSSSSYGYGAGAEVEVYASRSAPEVVRMAGFGDLWLFGAGFFLLGGIFPPLGVWILFRLGITRRRGPDGAPLG